MLGELDLLPPRRNETVLTHNAPVGLRIEIEPKPSRPLRRYGRGHGAGTISWTQAQLNRLAAHDLDALLELWAETTDSAPGLLEQSPKLVGGQFVFDALTPEHDNPRRTR